MQHDMLANRRKRLSGNMPISPKFGTILRGRASDPPAEAERGLPRHFSAGAGASRPPGGPGSRRVRKAHDGRDCRAHGRLLDPDHAPPSARLRPPASQIYPNGSSSFTSPAVAFATSRWRGAEFRTFLVSVGASPRKTRSRTAEPFHHRCAQDSLAFSSARGESAPCDNTSCRVITNSCWTSGNAYVRGQSEAALRRTVIIGYPIPA